MLIPKIGDVSTNLVFLVIVRKPTLLSDQRRDAATAKRASFNDVDVYIARCQRKPFPRQANVIGHRPHQQGQQVHGVPDIEVA
jgi:hypothetical protein